MVRSPPHLRPSERPRRHRRASRSTTTRCSPTTRTGGRRRTLRNPDGSPLLRAAARHAGLAGHPAADHRRAPSGGCRGSSNASTRGFGASSATAGGTSSRLERRRLVTARTHETSPCARGPFRTTSNKPAKPPGDAASRKAWVDPGPSRWSLVFDTETLTDLSQRLRIGCLPGAPGQPTPRRGPLLRPRLRSPRRNSRRSTTYADDAWPGAARPRSEFVDDVFFPIAYTRRGLLIGFNLPYDLARLAVDHTTARAGHAVPAAAAITEHGDARRRSRSSCPRIPYWPRVQIKRVGTSAAFIRFATPDGRHPEARNRENGRPSRRTTAATSSTSPRSPRPCSAAAGRSRTLAETLNTPHQKQDVDGHGQEITPEYLDYARTDVQVTWECYANLARPLRDLPAVARPLHRIFSEASIGKAHLRDLGLAAMARRASRTCRHEIIATIMETYYGGRSECGIRRVPIPGVYLDFTSQYPTVFVLQGLWRFLTAQGVDVAARRPRDRPAPARHDHRRRRARPRDLDERCTHSCSSSPTATCCRPAPSTGPADTAHTPSAAPIAHGGPAQWWCLADCIASTLQTGKAPRVLDVLRFAPARPATGPAADRRRRQPRLPRSTPTQDDLIKRLIELRAITKRRQRDRRSATATTSSRPSWTRSSTA